MEKLDNTFAFSQDVQEAVDLAFSIALDDSYYTDLIDFTPEVEIYEIRDVASEREEFKAFFIELRNEIYDLIEDLSSEKEFKHLEYDMHIKRIDSYNKAAFQLEISHNFYEEDTYVSESGFDDIDWAALHNMPDLETYVYEI